jgi:hypothetical protein
MELDLLVQVAPFLAGSSRHRELDSRLHAHLALSEVP